MLFKVQIVSVLILVTLNICEAAFGQKTPNHWYVQHTSVDDLLYYIENQPKFTYDEARDVCLSLQMTKPYHVSGIRFSKLPINGEMWVPNTFPTGDIVKYTNGTLNKVRSYNALLERKGFICVTILQAVILEYRNGTSVMLRTSEHAVPKYCYPQKKLSADELDGLGLAVCLLVHMKFLENT